MFKLFVEIYFFVSTFCKINIFVVLQTFFNIAKANFKLAGTNKNACAGAKTWERRILHSPRFLQTTV